MLTERFEQALVLAARWHRTQIRKGSGVPYVSHLLGVASIALEHGADEDQAIAALLHDAIEDAGGAEARERIREAFGDRVAALVDGCTDADVTPKPPWAERKSAYLAHLPEAPAEVLLISASDKLHNARSILMDLRDPAVGEGLWERFNAGKEGSLWYYRSLLAAYERSGKVPESLLAELAGTIEAMERQAGYQAEPYPALPPN